MPIVGGLDIHRKQITFDYLDTATGEVKRSQIAPADRAHVRAWLARFAGHGDVAFAVEGCAGWRYVAGELAAAGIAAHLGEPADTAALRGRKRHAKTDKTDARHLRALLAEGRLPECWLPPEHILEYRALLETYHDLRAAHTAWVQRIHAVFFHQGAPPLSEGALRTEPGLAGYAGRALARSLTRSPRSQNRQLSGAGSGLRHTQNPGVKDSQSLIEPLAVHRPIQVRRLRSTPMVDLSWMALRNPKSRRAESVRICSPLSSSLVHAGCPVLVRAGTVL